MVLDFCCAVYMHSIHASGKFAILAIEPHFYYYDVGFIQCHIHASKALYI